MHQFLYGFGSASVLWIILMIFRVKAETALKSELKKVKGDLAARLNRSVGGAPPPTPTIKA